ncbi:MAG: cytochrome c peroxidase [Bacteroidota bacterium]
MKGLVRFGVIGGISLLLLFSCQKKEVSQKVDLDYPEEIKRVFLMHVADHEVAARVLDSLAQNNASSKELQKAFFKARLAYKKVEILGEFYYPVRSVQFNGPALDKPNVNDARRKTIPPSGYQVVEEYLFPDFNAEEKETALHEISRLAGLTEIMSRDATIVAFSNENIFEAVRLEFLRIVSLGISGFDSPVAFHSLPEAIAALEGLEEMLAVYKDQASKAWSSLSGAFDAAKAYLKEHNDFDTFNRIEFITKHINELSKLTYDYQKALGIKNNEFNIAMNMDAETLFGEDAYNIDHFAPKYNRNASEGQIALGKLLFFDPVLSGNNTRSCASCHVPEKAFTDGQKTSLAFDLKGNIQRNAPTIISAAYQRSLFYDSRVAVFEDQVTDVVSNAEEMHGSMDNVAVRLNNSTEYKKLFEEAFDADSITGLHVRSAIASYERSLKGMNSRFDQYLRGDEAVLSANEILGFNLFMGKAKCGICHFTPLFNGAIPPNYIESESEVIGVPVKNVTANATIDPDVGKYNLYQAELHRFAFKTPTVRNAALTAPYMHNGVYETLEEVIDFYNRGGGSGIGIELPNQTLPEDELNLSTKEQKAIIEFIGALTDTTGLVSVPERLPQFDGDPALNNRKTGGKY